MIETAPAASQGFFKVESPPGSQQPVYSKDFEQALKKHSHELQQVVYDSPTLKAQEARARLQKKILPKQIFNPCHQLIRDQLCLIQDGVATEAQIDQLHQNYQNTLSDPFGQIYYFGLCENLCQSALRATSKFDKTSPKLEQGTDNLACISYVIRFKSCAIKLLEKVNTTTHERASELNEMLARFVFEMFREITNGSYFHALFLKKGEGSSDNLTQFNEIIHLADRHMHDFRAAVEHLDRLGISPTMWPTIRYMVDCQEHQMWVQVAYGNFSTALVALNSIDDQMQRLKEFIDTWKNYRQSFLDLHNTGIILLQERLKHYEWLREDTESARSRQQAMSDKSVLCYEVGKLELDVSLDKDTLKGLIKHAKALIQDDKTGKARYAQAVLVLKEARLKCFYRDPKCLQDAVALATALRNQVPKDVMAGSMILKILNDYIASAVGFIKECSQPVQTPPEPHATIEEQVNNLIQEIEQLDIAYESGAPVEAKEPEKKSPQVDEAKVQEIQKLKREAKKLRKKVKNLENQATEKTKQLASSQAKYQNQHEENQALQAQLTRMQSAQSELGMVHALLEQSFEELRVKQLEAEETVKSLCSELERRELEMTGQARNIEASEAKQLKQTAKLASMFGQLAGAQEKILAQGAELFHSRLLLREQQDEIALLKAALQAQGRSLPTLQQKIEGEACRYQTGIVYNLPEDVSQVMAWLRAQGGVGFIHGGFVRSCFFGVSFSDIDVIVWHPNPEDLYQHLPSNFQSTAKPFQFRDYELNIDLYFTKATESIYALSSRKDTLEDSMLIDDLGRLLDPLNIRKNFDHKTIHCNQNLLNKLNQDWMVGFRILKQSNDLSFEIPKSDLQIIVPYLPRCLGAPLSDYLKAMDILWQLKHPLEAKTLTQVMPWLAGAETSAFEAISALWLWIRDKKGYQGGEEYRTLAYRVLPLLIVYRISDDEQAMASTLQRVTQCFKNQSSDDVRVLEARLRNLLPEVRKDFETWKALKTKAKKKAVNDPIVSPQPPAIVFSEVEFPSLPKGRQKTQENSGDKKKKAYS